MDVKELIERINRAQVLGDLELAAELARRLVEEVPNSAQAHIVLGNICTRQEEHNEAIMAFQQAVELEPRNAEAYNNLGVVYKNAGNFTTAFKAFDSALQLEPERGDIFYNLGNAHKSAGNTEKAEENYRRAIALSPEISMAWNNLGTLMEAAGKHSHAEELYRSGLEQDLSNPTLRYNLGVCLQSRGKLRDAEKEFESALERRPGWMEGLNNLGIVQLKLGHQERALETFGEIRQRDPKNIQAGSNLAYTLASAGRYEESENLYQELVEQCPDCGTIRMNLSRLYRMTEKWDKALETLDTIDRSTVDRRVIDGLYARTYVESGSLSSGEELVDMLLEEDPENTEGLLTRGLLDARLKKWESSEGWLRKAIDSSPGNPEIRLNLVSMLEEQGRDEDAEAEIRSFLDQSPASVPGREKLAGLLLEQNKVKESAALFAEIKTIEPENTKALKGLIETSRRQGNNEQAVVYSEELAGLTADRAGDELDELTAALDQRDSLAEEYSQAFAGLWEKNVSKLFSRDDEGIIEIDKIEEESLLFDSLPDIAGETVPILDSGGIEPVISVNETSELVIISDVEEEIPDIDPDDLLADTILEKIEEARNPEVNPVVVPVQTSPVGSSPFPQVMKIETGAIEVRRLDSPKPDMEVKFVPKPPPPPPAPPEEPEEKKEDLLGYLQSLTRYLPPETSQNFKESGMDDKIRHLRKVVEPHGGLEKVMTDMKKKEVRRKEQGKKISGTLNFIQNLTEYAPDKDLRADMRAKIGNILEKIEKL